MPPLEIRSSLNTMANLTALFSPTPDLSLHDFTPYTGPPHILRLPTELLQDIFLRLPPAAFLNTRQTCRVLLTATESRALFLHHLAGFGAETKALDMISLKRELFARVTEQTGVLEKCRSGAMGRVYRSTVGVTGRVLLARGDATFLLLCGQGVVHVYMTVDAQSGRLREPHRIVARPPRFLFSWKVGGSRVKAFYCSRGREVKGSTLGGEAGFLLLHEDGSATLGMALLGGTVEAEGVQWEKRIKEPCRELETEGLRRSEVEVTAAAISAACRQYAFACRAGVAIYHQENYDLALVLYQWLPTRPGDPWVTDIIMGGTMSRCCLISGTSTLVIPWYHNLYQYSTGHTPIDADPLLLLPTIHPLSYTPALSPVFLMRHQPWEHLLAPGKSRADTPYADFALLLSAGENVCISIVHELGRECVCRIELRHPRGLDASTLVEHAAVMVDHFVYLVAVRYACGRVWLYEWRAGGLRDRELEGELLGFVPGAREMGFALKKVDTVREVRKTLAALVVVTGRGLVVWQCSVGRSWRSCGLAPPKREDDN